MSTAVQTQPNLPRRSALDVELSDSPPSSPPAVSPSSTVSDMTQKQKSPTTPAIPASINLKPTSPSPDKVFKVIVVSDMICPWCYIAFESINRALRDVALSILPKEGPKFEVEFRPFPLITNFGSDDVAVDKAVHLASKFPAEKIAQIKVIMKKRGEELGINFKFGGMIRQTTRSHRLLTLAYHRGGMSLQQSLLAHLFKAYFEEEKDIGDPATLAYYADLVGLMDKATAEEWIKGKEYEEETKKLVMISQGCNISGVPFVVVDGKWAISGGQPEGEYFKIFNRLAKGEVPPPS